MQGVFLSMNAPPLLFWAVRDFLITITPREILVINSQNHHGFSTTNELYHNLGIRD